MIFLGHEKCRKWFDFYRNRFIKFSRISDFFFYIFSDFFLSVILIENCRRITISLISKLSVYLCWVDLCKVESSECLIGYQLWIILYLYYLSMVCMSCGNLVIGRCFLCASSVSRDSLCDACLGFKYPFHAPKTSSSELCTSSVFCIHV